jgi:pimeloyl-ACP methyl ester carboxylesterase
MQRTFILLALLVAATAAGAQPAATIHVRSTGEGARCWILLHPFGASGRFWERRAALLASAHNVRIYSPDLPSHGRSGLAERFDYDHTTDAVAAATRRDCRRPALIVGASSGGIVAVKLAARLRVPVAAIGVGWSFSEANVAAMRASAAHPSEGLSSWLANFVEQGEGQIARIRHHFADLAAIGTGPLFTRRETWALDRRLLVLWGENDDFFGRESVDRLVAAVPGTRLETFPGAGHLEPFAPPHADRSWRLIGDFAAD